ncbi:MAG: 16S rRNA (cytosine(1402)-N(4))-methyltransferase RsmH [Bacteroidota bacterium]|nr:16S rRNA (cytosine(1402)-N(4))-methyltransferase RsmH [Bacteroidota bacterium]
MSNDYHISVLREEAVDALVTTAHGVYVDGTLGGGGHAEAIATRIFPLGTLVGIDADADAIAEARQRLVSFESDRLILVHDNVSNIRTILRQHNIRHIHGFLLDLGVSSFQLNEKSKGFSFRTDDTLDMRMDRRQALDARTVVNTYSEEELTRVFQSYGEEKFSGRFARAVVEYRERKQIETTGELASIIENKAGGRFFVKALARIFQALRIEVNHELENLSRALRDTMEFLVSGSRIVAISYHSLEDRIVKNFFQQEAADKAPSGSKLVPDTLRVPRLRIVTKKPVIPTEEERVNNPRSRSAKMRVAEKI